jgi:hypothetical protein
VKQPSEAPKPAADQPKPDPKKPRNTVAAIFTIPTPPQQVADPFTELYGNRGAPETPATKPADPPAAPAAADRPPPTKNEMLQDINAEAAEKRQEMNQLRDLKDHAQSELAEEAMSRTEDERVVFRRELREILKSKSRTAGQEINDLCEKFGRNYDPVLKDKVSRALMLTNGRMTTNAKLHLLRHYGVPEPGLLDYLANVIAHNEMNARNGPRTPDQVRVIAARRLLETRLTKAARGTDRQAYDPTAAPIARNPQ